MTTRGDIFMALHDAIGWQYGLVDSWGRRTPEGQEALALIRRYKTILRRRYGRDTTAFDEQLKKCKMLTLDEIVSGLREADDTGK